ncbi:MAG: glycosyltransferase family 1 protein [Alphaproteobacteria bacterium]|nr:glycosyltransferase family 1 protein [Alphaproteobacteria bacterium]
MKRRYVIAFLLEIIFLVGLGIFFFISDNKSSVSLYSYDFILKRNVYPFIEELSEDSFFKRKKVGFYLANFLEKDNIIVPKKDEDISIIWLGGKYGVNDENLKYYDYIFVTTYSLQNYLKLNNIKSYYLPLVNFGNQVVKKNDKKKKIFGIIGNHPIIEEILNKRGIEYKKYSLDNIEELEKDLDVLETVFASNTNFYNKNLDLHPIFYKLLYNHINVVSRWYWPNYERLKIFNDAVSYYIGKDDAEILLDDILAENKSIIDRKNFAHNLVERFFSQKTNIKRVLYALKKNKDYYVEPKKDSINIDVVVSVGHISGGDFWLAKDLLNFFTENRFVEKSMTFLDSIIKYEADYNIVISGILPIGKTDYVGKKNILYIAYPSFEDINGVETIKDIDDYITDIKNKCQEAKGIDLVISASKIFNDELNKRGIKSYYVPQFTDTKRFYPDYIEELKSDVFFVGVNTYYRKAWKYLYNEGIDVTIYGPNYPEGVSKGDYIDNRILRKYYSSAKIVLNDTRDGMIKYGFIGNRIFDATASGALVISDYMKEIEDIYGDSVVMWKTKEELIEKVKYYLDPQNEAERLEKANRARYITLKNFTAEIVAKKFKKVFDELR